MHIASPNKLCGCSHPPISVVFVTGSRSSGSLGGFTLNKGLLLGLFVVAVIHAALSLLLALGLRSYFWYASFLATVIVANIIGHHPTVYAELTKKD